MNKIQTFLSYPVAGQGVTQRTRAARRGRGWISECEFEMAMELDSYSDYSEDFEEEDTSALPSSNVSADTAMAAGGRGAVEVTADANEESTPKKRPVLAKFRPSTTRKFKGIHSCLYTILIK